MLGKAYLIFYVATINAMCGINVYKFFRSVKTTILSCSVVALEGWEFSPHAKSFS